VAQSQGELFRFRARGERALSSPPALEAAPLDIRNPSSVANVAANGLSLDPASVDSATWGHRVRDVYLNDPALQKIYPLGLFPLANATFWTG